MGDYAGTIIGPDGKRYPIGTVFPVPLPSEIYRTYGSPVDGQVGVWNAETKRVEWGAGQDGQSVAAIEAAILSLSASLDEMRLALVSLASLNGLSGQADHLDEFLTLLSVAAMEGAPPRLVTGTTRA